MNKFRMDCQRAALFLTLGRSLNDLLDGSPPNVSDRLKLSRHLPRNGLRLAPGSAEAIALDRGGIVQKLYNVVNRRAAMQEKGPSHSSRGGGGHPPAINTSLPPPEGRISEDTEGAVGTKSSESAGRAR